MDSNCSEITKKRKIPTRVAGPVESKKEPCQLSLASSLDILNKYGNRLKRFNKEKLKEFTSDGTPCDTTTAQELSTGDIIRLGRARFLHHVTQWSDDPSMLIDPFKNPLCGYSYEVLRNVELVEILLASVEKVSNKQFDRAIKLLSKCEQMSSANGNPVERVVHYFAEALSERIDRETGKVSKEGDNRHAMEIEDAMTNLKPAFVVCLEKLPFCQVTQFTNIQAILDSVVSAKRIHLVDIGIRSGMQWTVLMQALAVRYQCPLELLKLTAIGTPRQSIQETGDRLVSFAKSMNIPFSFRTVVVPDFEDLKEDLFELEAGEVVAVYSTMILSNMLARPSRLEALMGVIRNLRPSVVVVAESEMNTNEATFMDRFVEALSFYGVLFDCIRTCVDESDPCRITTEAELFGRCIQNMVATEGEERTYRHVKIDTWRNIFARFGMVETELSSSSLYQVNLLIKKFACGNFCTIDFNGKCLLLGWKGTPIHSISSWKFHQG
ncbi:DELLA protein RGL2-like [Cornus florida]|uniref:DELLA protein RGL2-like n=1 Tax=Cornus florida TaxID=4283 RepID=UPI0028A0C9EC|nr:DELLA protein RGL2-like [Cornus florida]